MQATVSVSAWLTRQGFGHYAAIFQQNAIDWDILFDLTAGDLRDMGIETVGERRRLLKVIAEAAQKPDKSGDSGDNVVAKPATATPTAPGISPAAERKWVTILFADIKDSTALVGDLDPEDAAERLATALSAMRTAVHQFAGTVNRTMGDGVMALFGAPKAQEAHAQLACHAGLAIIATVARAAPDLKVRVGIHSGQVLARLVDTDIGQDYDAIGPAVHLASRLEQLAAPGTVYISAETAGLARGMVQVTELAPQAVKGFDAPVSCYQLTGLHPAESRFGIRVAAGLSPFIGRRQEMAALQGVLASATLAQPYFVTLSGDPGVGKSRLAHELLQTVDREAWDIITVAATPQSQMDINGVLRTFVSRLLVLDGGAESGLADHLPNILRGLGPDLAACLTPLRALLGLKVTDEKWLKADTPIRRRRILDAIQRLIGARSRRRPVFIFLEDLHWLDSESLAVLETISAVAPPMRLFVLCTARREFRPPWRRQRNATVIQLEDLQLEAAERLVTALIGRDPSLNSFRQRLIHRTAGRPLFLEEAVQAAAARGDLIGEPGQYQLAAHAGEIDVPRSVQAVISARLDAIDVKAKEIIQLASVIGERFPHSLLMQLTGKPAAVLEEPLAALGDADYIRLQQIYPEAIYAFKHALLRDVAYEEIPRGERRQWHGKILTALEDRQDHDSEVTADILAYHAYQGRRWDKAIQYLIEAGTQALQQSAYSDAAKQFDRALRALRRAGAPISGKLELELRIRAGLHSSILSTGDYARLLVEARHIEMLAERGERHLDLVKIRAGMTNNLVHLGFPEEALAVNTLAGNALKRLGNEFWNAAVATQLAETLYYLGRPAEARTLLRPHLAQITSELRHIRYGIVSLSIFYLTILQGAAIALGELGEAEETAALIQEILQEDGALLTDISAGMAMNAVLHHYAGDYAAALRDAKRALEICEGYELWYQYAWVGGQFALSSAIAGETARGLAVGRTAVKIADRLALPTHRTATRIYLALVLLLLGETNEALALSETALILARQHHFALFEMMVLPAHILALMLQGHPDHPQIEQALAAGFRLADGAGSRLTSAQLYILQSALMHDRGDRQAADKALAAAGEIYRAIGLQKGVNKIATLRQQAAAKEATLVTPELTLLGAYEERIHDL